MTTLRIALVLLCTICLAQLAHCDPNSGLILQFPFVHLHEPDEPLIGQPHTVQAFSHKKLVSASGRVGASFEDPDTVLSIAPQPITSDGMTLAAWFLAPLPSHDVHSETHMLRSLFSGASDSHVAVEHNLELGVFVSPPEGRGFTGCGFSLNPISDGWHHLAAVITKTDTVERTQFYVDGQHACSVGAASGQPIVAIGNAGPQHHPHAPFGTTVADVRVYSRSLTPTELLEVMQSLDRTTADVDKMIGVAEAAESANDPRHELPPAWLRQMEEEKARKTNATASPGASAIAKDSDEAHRNMTSSEMAKDLLQAVDVLLQSHTPPPTGAPGAHHGSGGRDGSRGSSGALDRQMRMTEMQQATMSKASQMARQLLQASKQREIEARELLKRLGGKPPPILSPELFRDKNTGQGASAAVNASLATFSSLVNNATAEALSPRQMFDTWKIARNATIKALLDRATARLAMATATLTHFDAVWDAKRDKLKKEIDAHRNQVHEQLDQLRDNMDKNWKADHDRLDEMLKRAEGDARRAINPMDAAAVLRPVRVLMTRFTRRTDDQRARFESNEANLLDQLKEQETQHMRIFESRRTVRKHWALEELAKAQSFVESTQRKVAALQQQFLKDVPLKEAEMQAQEVALKKEREARAAGMPGAVNASAVVAAAREAQTEELHKMQQQFHDRLSALNQSLLSPKPLPGLASLDWSPYREPKPETKEKPKEKRAPPAPKPAAAKAQEEEEDTDEGMENETGQQQPQSQPQPQQQQLQQLQQRLQRGPGRASTPADAPEDDLPRKHKARPGLGLLPPGVKMMRRLHRRKALSQLQGQRRRAGKKAGARGRWPSPTDEFAPPPGAPEEDAEPEPDPEMQLPPGASAQEIEARQQMRTAELAAANSDQKLAQVKARKEAVDKAANIRMPPGEARDRAVTETLAAAIAASPTTGELAPDTAEDALNPNPYLQQEEREEAHASRANPGQPPPSAPVNMPRFALSEAQEQAEAEAQQQAQTHGQADAEAEAAADAQLRGEAESQAEGQLDDSVPIGSTDRAPLQDQEQEQDQGPPPPLENEDQQQEGGPISGSLDGPSSMRFKSVHTRGRAHNVVRRRRLPVTHLSHAPPSAAAATPHAHSAATSPVASAHAPPPPSSEQGGPVGRLSHMPLPARRLGQGNPVGRLSRLGAQRVWNPRHWPVYG